MKYDFITVFRLASATLLPVVLSVILYIADRKTRFGKIKYWAKQLLVGLLFGGVAVLSTEFGIPVSGAVLNVRNAAPLTAGLLFGGPAGIIAGVIGGTHRWLATLWGAGAFSRLACSLACVMAGLFGAGCRKFMFDNKKPSWFYGLAIGVTTEVLHILLLFITNMNDIYTSYSIVEICAIPMILCNGISVMLSLIAVALIGKEKKKRSGARQIAQVFQFILLICIVSAFCVTSLFTGVLQTEIAYSNADNLLKLNLDDVSEDVIEASDSNLLKITEAVSTEVTLADTQDKLTELMRRYNVAEINLIGKDGVICGSTNPDFVGIDMAQGEQSSEFLRLLDGQQSLVQSYQPISADGNISRKYAGVALQDGGFVQVGYNAEQFQSDLAERVKLAVKNRHIGRQGGIIVCDENYRIVSDNGGHEGQIAIENGDAFTETKSGVRFTATVQGIESYCIYTVSEGFFLIAAIPVSEAMFSRNIAVSILMFMEVLVFAALFINVYFLIKRLIVDNIHRINNSLAQITGGNLNVQVNVREQEEFASLSDDINATVDTLKKFIAEAESRIDRELEFARQIQHSALPSVFPPYPERRDFDIFASMDAAKEVGGDFYDFYLTDKKHLVFLIADVSGKGIPGALFMMRAKTLLKNLAKSGRGIDEVFNDANRALCENNEAEMFVTAWMGMLNTETGTLQYVNAGHNPPVLLRATGAAEFLRARPNLVLAGMDGTRYRKYEISLAPGDGIFLYTDGVTEAENPEHKLYGEDRLLKAVSDSERNPVKICEHVRADVDGFAENAEQFDDITMLCMRMNYTENESTLCTLPDRESISSVLNFANARLDAMSLPSGVKNKVQAAIDEIYSNIVFYSKAKSAKLTLCTDNGKLILVFEDDGVPYDPTAERNPDVTLSAEERKVGGLGIFLVKRSASEVRYENRDGKNILTVGFDVE